MMMVSCICGHVGVWMEWSSIGRTDASFAFTLTDADILSCLLSLRFAGALPLILARSFPPLHSHALMRALAFTLHLSSPLSPTRSGFRLCCARPSTLLHIVLLVSAAGTVLSSSHLHHLHFFTFQSHLSYLLYAFTLPAPLCLSHSLPPFFFLPSHPSYLLFQSALPPPPPPTTCLCS